MKHIRHANAAIPIIVSCTIIGITGRQAGITIIVKITETPGGTATRQDIDIVQRISRGLSAPGAL